MAKKHSKKLVEKAKDGFGDDLYYLIPAYENMDDKAKVELYKSVVDHYLNSVEFAQKDTNLALDFIADTYSKFYGTSKEKYLKNLTVIKQAGNINGL